MMLDQATLGLLGLIITVALAFCGYGAKYWNDLHLEKKKAEIKLVSDQIQYLYGPLHALCCANAAAWSTFRFRYHSDQASFFAKGSPPTPLDLEAWRQWMTEVFMPTNRAIIEIILKNTHLIDESSFPTSFAELIGHVKTYEVVLSKWAKNDFSEHTAYTNYPDSLDEDVRLKFVELKSRQVALLTKSKVRV
jgi:hypothetical protein